MLPFHSKLSKQWCPVPFAFQHGNCGLKLSQRAKKELVIVTPRCKCLGPCNVHTTGCSNQAAMHGCRIYWNCEGTSIYLVSHPGHILEQDRSHKHFVNLIDFI